MSRIKGLRRAFRLPWSTRSRVIREVDEELRFHLDMKAQELVAAGVPPEEAHRLARAEFGDIDSTRCYMRRSDGHRMMKERRAEIGDELRQDIRFTLRQLRRSPAFTAVALLTPALEIGANAAIFSVVRGVLLRDLPYADPNALLRIYSTFDGRASSVSPADFVDWSKQAKPLAAIRAEG